MKQSGFMMKKDKILGRGGPNRNQGRHALYDKPMRRLSVMLDEETIRRARWAGNGNVSAGIRRAIAMVFEAQA